MNKQQTRRRNTQNMKKVSQVKSESNLVAKNKKKGIGRYHDTGE